MADDHQFLTSIHVHNAYAVRDLEIPISTDGKPRHLILTGPNGSGKSAILRGLVEQKPNPGTSYQTAKQRLEEVEAQHAAGQAPELQLTKARRAFAKATSIPVVEKRPHLPSRILLHLPAARTWQPHVPAGPQNLNLRGAGTVDASQHFLQYLVNERVQQSLARDDGDEPGATAIGIWFEQLEQNVRHLFDDEGLSLRFERQTFKFFLEHSDGRSVQFTQLPDGLASVMQLWSAIMLAVEGVDDPRGLILIDEPELHLHARLQELILPFLTDAFSTLQFIVATHSPAVIASIPNATVFDLKRREAVPSEEFEGIRYGNLLIEHFGIETDFDVATTKKLRRMKELHDAQPAPGSPAHGELLSLADDLRDQPHLLVARVLRELDQASDQVVGDD